MVEAADARTYAKIRKELTAPIPDSDRLDERGVIKLKRLLKKRGIRYTRRGDSICVRPQDTWWVGTIVRDEILARQYPVWR